MSRTIAGIVAFYPDPARVLRLIASIADDVSRIVLFANSPLEAAIKNGLSTAAAQTSVTLIAPGENVGLGSAYNRIVELARLEGAEFVLLFDQDSTPSEGMVRRLEHLADELKSRGEKPAVVGPRPTKANGEPFKVPRRRSSAEGLPGLAVDFAISSGSLIALRATAEVGPFNEEFFIDAIDIEWCEGLERRRSVLGVDIPMTHRLGRGVIHLPLGLRLTDQPSERLYTYFRNQVAMLRLPHVPSAWKLRFIASLPARCLIYALRNGFARPAVSAIIFGLIDGIAHRLGPPPAAGRQSRPLSSKLSDSHPNSPFFARRCAISP